MAVTLFLSHSFSDGTSCAEHIVSTLQDVTSVRLWSPSKEMRLGVRWLAQAAEVIDRAHALLFLMTPDALKDKSACRSECILAQQIGVPVIPVRASERVQDYPQFVWPGTIWVDGTNAKGLIRLREELMTLLDRGRANQQIPPDTWNAKKGPFAKDAGLYVGRWRVERRPNRRLVSLSPNYLAELFPDSRFEERPEPDRRGMFKVAGTWGLHHDGITLMFAASNEIKKMAIDSSFGPNLFAGITADVRFTARRMLEL